MDELLHAWRHPRVAAAQGRCIGRSDLRVDPRRARRLAHRIRAFAQRHGLPRIVVTSPLARSRAVGDWLARWGWLHRVDAALSEVDFGDWDGLAWSAVPTQEIDAWCADFEHFRPGGGEAVGALLQRVSGFEPGPARIVVTHGGWLSAAAWLKRRRDRLSRGEREPIPLSSEHWPMPPAHGSRNTFSLRAGDDGLA
jgi:alpha-ribazole phosphatase